MKHNLIFDSDESMVETMSPQPKRIAMSSYVKNLRSKLLNLGLLPPVTKLITPLDELNEFSVVVECRPRRQTILFTYNGETQQFNVPLPWHSFILNLHYESSFKEIHFRKAGLFFHSREIQSIDDINLDFFKETWIPNAYSSNDICLGSEQNELNQLYKASQFGQLYYDFANAFWGSSFNADLGENLVHYSKCFGNKTTIDFYPDAIRFVLFELQDYNLEDVCNDNFLLEFKNKPSIIQTFPYVLGHFDINPVINFYDLMKSTGVSNDS